MNRTIRKLLLFAAGFTLPLAAFSLFNIGPFGMSPFKLATILLLIVAAVEFTLSQKRRPSDQTSVWVMAYGLAIVISVFQGFVQGVPAARLINETTTYGSILLFYFLVAFVVDDISILRTLLWGLVLGGVTTSTAAITGLGGVGGSGRAYGLSGHANVLGIDMAIVAPIAIGLGLGTSSRAKRAILFAAAAISIGGLLRSLSRSALLAGGAMWGFWMLRSGRIDSIRYVIPAVLLGIGALFFAPTEVVERLQTVTDARQRSADGSIGARMVQYEFSVRAFASNPVTGVGLLNFTLWSHKQPGGQVIHHVVHSSYMSILAEMGLLGFIPYMIILLTTWMQYGQAYRTARRRRRLRDPTLTELAALALFLQMALFGSMTMGATSIMQKSKTMWLIIALAPIVRHFTLARVQELEGDAAASAQPAAERSFGDAGLGASWTR